MEKGAKKEAPESLSPPASTEDEKVVVKIEEKIEGKIEGKVEGKVEEKVEGKTEGKVEGKVEGKTEGKLEAKIEDKVEEKIEEKSEGNIEQKIEGKVDGIIEWKNEEKDEGKDEGNDEGKVDGRDEKIIELIGEGKIEGKDKGKVEEKDEEKIQGKVEGKDKGKVEENDEEKIQGIIEGKDEGKVVGKVESDEPVVASTSRGAIDSSRTFEVIDIVDNDIDLISGSSGCSNQSAEFPDSGYNAGTMGIIHRLSIRFQGLFTGKRYFDRPSNYEGIEMKTYKRSVYADPLENEQLPENSETMFVPEVNVTPEARVFEGFERPNSPRRSNASRKSNASKKSNGSKYSSGSEYSRSSENSSKNSERRSYRSSRRNSGLRETWGREIDFLLSIIGFAVDLANVWRFPYLCYRNGGGAFLIPYFLMLIFGAVPLFYMEVILGQYNRQGPISVWRTCPIFKGIGYCAVMIAFYVSFYYNVIIGWSLYFMWASATPQLPWMHCNNTWNTNLCTEYLNGTMFNTTMQRSAIFPHSPATEYFHRAVLEMQYSKGIHELGYPRWELVICLQIVYIMLYVSLFKGVKSSGIVVWFTATVPYLILTVLLCRGLMLPGAYVGITYYLKPELSRLRDTQVWVDAAVQVFYSVGAGFGVHLSYASYNNFHNNCYADVLVTTLVNCFTSFFSGLVIFTYLGYMSHKQGVPISAVATEGPGLVFQVYPEAIATLPYPQLWAMLFFFMLIMLGIDSAMGGLECVITGLMDEYAPFFAGRRYAREIFTLITICLSFCVALINITPGGIYMFNLFDTYSAGISLLCSALFEAIAVAWIYGLERFSEDVEVMLGYRPGLYWRICWKFISPLFLIGVIVFGLVYHEPMQYQDYKYPAWAEWIGWGLAFSSIFMIPLVAVIQLIRAPGTWKERIAFVITPVDELNTMFNTNQVSRFRRRHWFYV